MLKICITFLLITSSSLFAMSLSELNSASQSKLMTIKGIGKKKANAIIKERRIKKFISFEDFTRVKGIGKKMALNVKNNITAKKKSLKKKTPSKKITPKKKPINE